jgi:hypothetical protein
MPNYQLGKIYAIKSHNTDKIYIGSTCDKRLSSYLGKHTYNYRKYLKGEKGFVSSFDVLECGDYYIELLEKVECTCKEELLTRERHYIKTMECVNHRQPGRTKKMYREDNKEHLNQYHKKWRENPDNKKSANERSKKFYQDNKVEQLAKQKAYYEANRAEKVAKQKAYYEANRERINARRRELAKLKREEK